MEVEKDYEDQEAAYQSNDVEEEEGGYKYEVILLDDDTWITA